MNIFCPHCRSSTIRKTVQFIQENRNMNVYPVESSFQNKIIPDET